MKSKTRIYVQGDKEMTQRVTFIFEKVAMGLKESVFRIFYNNPRTIVCRMEQMPFDEFLSRAALVRRCLKDAKIDPFEVEIEGIIDNGQNTYTVFKMDFSSSEIKLKKLSFSSEKDENGKLVNEAVIDIESRYMHKLLKEEMCGIGSKVKIDLAQYKIAQDAIRPFLPIWAAAQ